MSGNRLAIEGALERGHLWAAMRNGRYWRLRRNGQTKLWKTMLWRWEIPVKAALKSYTTISDESDMKYLTDIGWRQADFLITSHDPNNAREMQLAEIEARA
jgi:hypothetical protein